MWNVTMKTARGRHKKITKNAFNLLAGMLLTPLAVLHAMEVVPVSPAPSSTYAAEQDGEHTFKRDELKVSPPTVPGFWPKNHKGWSIADLKTFQHLFKG